MSRKFNSVVDELLNTQSGVDNDVFVEARATQVVASALNLKRMLESRYTEEVATDLYRWLQHAIRTGDMDKFRRKLERVRQEDADD